MIRDRQTILTEIQKSSILQAKFKSWMPQQQEEFLNLCTGVRGLKLLYDGFFKEVMNPEYVPKRLNDFLSHMLCQKVTILKVLPGDSTRITDESSLLIMDIVVELEDRSIANVEMQKVGYRFPGQRSACYSADLLLRQYKRIRGETEKNFSYRDIKNVYTIVLFETSPKEFHTYPNDYYHFFEQKSDTGLEMELLQKYLFVPLDIFRKSQHNKSINNKRDAWLTLFSSDDPDTVITLITAYPEFRKIYEEAYTLCLNIERVMEMFSEELAILDRNTVKYMMDEMQGEMDEMQDRINEMKSTISGMQGTIDGMQGTIDGMQGTIDDQKIELNKKQSTIEEIQKKYDSAFADSIRNTAAVLQSLNIPEPEIIRQICSQYHISETQAQQYL